MSRVGIEPTIPVFERAKMVYALDRAATVTDIKRDDTSPVNMKPALIQVCRFVFLYLLRPTNTRSHMHKGQPVILITSRC
jgi:hypothetical protein